MATIPGPVKDAEAAALTALYVDHTELSHGQFGAQFGIGTAGMVWQYLNAHRPLNLDAARKFASGLGVAIDAFSPRLASSAHAARENSRQPTNAVAMPGTAAEAPSPYPVPSTPRWPFKTISRDEMEKLSADQLEVVEAVMRPLIDRALSPDPGKRHAA